jgi:hypothetical protein
MIQFIKDNINGILGTVIFHLLIVVLILATRLSSFEHQDEHSILVEFDIDVSEEEFREYTESLLAQNLLDYESSQTRNIAVNVSADRPVADQFKDMSPQEASELESRINEILNDAKNGIMPKPEQPEINFEPPVLPVREQSEDTEPYSGPTTITYDLPGRTHIRVPVPVYKCPEGGIVEVNISVDRQGKVLKANIDGSPDDFNESCNHQMALEAAMSSRFSQNTDSPAVQTGIITFYFQKQ